jgi:hypothetical protein
MCCIASRHVGQAHPRLARVSLGGLRSPPRCGQPGRTIKWDLRNAPARGPLSRFCWRVPEGLPLARTPTPRSGTRTDFAARLRDLHHVRAGHGRRRCTTRPASGAVCAGSNPAGGALSEYVSDKCRGNRWHTAPSTVSPPPSPRSSSSVLACEPTPRPQPGAPPAARSYVQPSPVTARYPPRADVTAPALSDDRPHDIAAATHRRRQIGPHAITPADHSRQSRNARSCTFSPLAAAAWS